MICRYSMTVRCGCPVDDLPDVYEVEFENSVLIRVEDILAAVSGFSATKVFQEDLTADLARRLSCRVRTVGYHSGVRTEVEAP